MNANTNAQRPGSTLTRFGLLLIGIGVLLAVVTIAAGGNAVVGWIAVLGWVSALGLLMVGIGFGQRILAALEK